MSNSNAENTPKNILGEPLAVCCTQPMTGFFRDGFCRTNAQDHGRHVVCAVITEAFLQFTLAQGNDLITPRPEYDFPGLKAGDAWCLCALRWKEAFEAGCAPFINPHATHSKALEYISLDVLKTHYLPHATH